MLTKAKLLDLLKKHNYVKSAVAEAVGTDEASIRRWCKKLKVDATFEKRKSILEYQPTIITLKSVEKPIVYASNAKLERVFVFSDVHIPGHSRTALSIAIQSCRDYKPTHAIIVGDFLDYTSLMGKEKMRVPDLSTVDLKAMDLEFVAGDKVLRDIENILPKGCIKIYLKGNHEDRGDKIIEKPNGDYWKKHIDIDIRLNLSGRGWKVFKYNDFVKLGRLNYTHGFYYDTHHAMHHARVYSQNVIYGHTHSVQTFTMPTPVRELSFWSSSIGCLSETNPEWLRGRPNSWDNAFAEVDYLENGDFFPHIHRLIHGRLVHPRGKIYRG